MVSTRPFSLTIKIPLALFHLPKKKKSSTSSLSKLKHITLSLSTAFLVRTQKWVSGFIQVLVLLLQLSFIIFFLFLVAKQMVQEVVRPVPLISSMGDGSQTSRTHSTIPRRVRSSSASSVAKRMAELTGITPNTDGNPMTPTYKGTCIHLLSSSSASRIVFLAVVFFLGLLREKLCVIITKSLDKMYAKKEV